METAVLVLAAVVHGTVTAGWRPDPATADGYVVTVHVDRATSLRLSGEEIAAAANIPKDIAPISSVEVKVAGGMPTRLRRMTVLKPPIPADVKLTQYFEPAAGSNPRYSGAGSFDPYASPAAAATSQPGYQGAQPASQYPAATTPAGTPAPNWNNQSLGTAANDLARSAAGQLQQGANQAAAPWVDQMRAQAQQAAAPLQNGIAQVDARIQSALQTFNNQAAPTPGAITPALDGQGLYRPPSQPTTGAAGSIAAWSPWAQAPAGNSPFAAATPTPASPAVAGSNAWSSPTLADGRIAASPQSGPTPASPFGADPRVAAAGAGQGAAWNGAPLAQTAPSQADPWATVRTPTNPAGTVTQVGGRGDRIDQPIDPRDAGNWTNTRVAAAVGNQATAPAVDRYGNPISNPGNATNQLPPRVASSTQSTRDGWPALLNSSSQAPAASTLPTRESAGSLANPADWTRVAAADSGAGRSAPPLATNALPEGPSFPLPAAGQRPFNSSPATATQDQLFGGTSSRTGAPSWPAPATNGGVAATAPQVGTGGTNASRPSPFDSDFFNVSSQPTTPSGPTRSPFDAPQTADPRLGASVPAAETSPFGSASPWPASQGGVGPTMQPNSQATTQPTSQPISQPMSEPRNMVPVVVAWVLLFGSAAGNAYLLWSYLEVRMKYRTLVRRNGQGVRSRLSPA